MPVTSSVEVPTCRACKNWASPEGGCRVYRPADTQGAYCYRGSVYCPLFKYRDSGKPALFTLLASNISTMADFLITQEWCDGGISGDFTQWHVYGLPNPYNTYRQAYDAARKLLLSTEKVNTRSFEDA